VFPLLLQVNETVNVHCGFYSDNGGFRISDEDTRYMRACKVVVSTCAFGGGDDLYQPIGMVNSSIGKVFEHSRLSVMQSLCKTSHSTTQWILDGWTYDKTGLLCGFLG
jgi:hypothetical protein